MVALFSTVCLFLFDCLGLFINRYWSTITILFKIILDDIIFFIIDDIEANNNDMHEVCYKPLLPTNGNLLTFQSNKLELIYLVLV
jgi:hypothetical protein